MEQYGRWANLWKISLSKKSLSLVLEVDVSHSRCNSSSHLQITNSWHKWGLVTEARDGLASDVEQYAREIEEFERWCNVIGSGSESETGCAFGALWSWRPFYSAAECTAKEAFQHAGPNIIFASGCPFRDVDLGGRVGHSNQGNNMYFPGIGLGTLMAGAHHISDGMVHAAAEELAAIMTPEQLQEGIIFPPVSRIREITARVAAAIVKEEVKEDIAQGYKETDIKELKRIVQDDSELMKYIEGHMWMPGVRR